jgi:hypothetical protein
MKKLIYLILFALIGSPASADFSATINKQINIEKEQKVSARIDGEQKLIEGLLKATPKEDTKITVDITWTTIIDKKNKINLSNVVSTIDLDGKFLKRGTSLLVKGSLPNNITIKTEEKENKDRPRDMSRSATNINTGGITSPIADNTTSNDIVKPEIPEVPAPIEKPTIISTYEGCPALYNSDSEIITIYKQDYYFDDEGKQVQVQNCYKVKDVTANYKTCSDFDDYTQRETYKRKQAYFTEDNKEYSAGGCMTEKTYKHDFQYESCDVIVDNEYYFHTGRIFYTDDKFEKTYLTDCMLNPYDEEVKQKLKVDYDNCPVDHSGLDSIYFGRYYYVDNENRKHTISDCMRTYLSQIPHKVEFVKWENFDNDRYALKWQKTYILYPQGSQQYELQPNIPIYITGNETDKIRYDYTPINIESRTLNDVKTLNCVNQMNTAVKCDIGANKNPKPNPSATQQSEYLGQVEQCNGTGDNCQMVDSYRYYWQWTDYTKQCNVVYKRPDNTTLNLNNWWTLITSWDANPVNNAVCK